jgi:hypothetical protein
VSSAFCRRACRSEGAASNCGNMDAFVAIQYDLEKLNQEILSHSKTESVVCVGLYELGEAELENLKRAETIYFVVSKISMGSTAYQMLLFATFPLVEIEKCYLLKLDDVPIPAGFPMLRALSERRPS